MIITIFQVRNMPKQTELIKLDIPDRLVPKVLDYIHTEAFGGQLQEKENYYGVKSPMLNIAVKAIKAMGNEEDGYVKEICREVL